MHWDFDQGGNFHAEMSASRAEMKADRHAGQLDDTKRQVERLSLACQAMWELLREYSGMSEEHIEAKILEIDGRDGKVDGKIATLILTCSSCGNPTNSKRQYCVICGAPVERPHQFEG